jgi:hypothetical protein
MNDQIETVTTPESTLRVDEPMAQPSAETIEEPARAAQRQQPVEVARMPYVYAIGQVEPRFPNVAVEREFAQVVARYDTQGMTDQEILQSVLSDRDNRYLARQMCWVFSIERLATYILAPRDPADLDRLIETVRRVPQPTDLEVVIGVRGPISPPEVCDGLSVPVVGFDQLYSFQREDLLGAIPVPSGITKKDEAKFRESAAELLDRFLQLADNAGSTDEHRALNYLAVRYPAVYARVVEAHNADMSLSQVDVRPSRLGEGILDIVFSYTHRQTDVTEKSFVRVNISGEFPFLVTKLQPFYER